MSSVLPRFLITTALETTWRDDEPVLFLGDWCRRYARKERWSKMRAEVLPYHWDDREKFDADYRYLSGLCERLLLDLAERLNGIHGVDHGTRYWRILIGPWLAYFLQMLFDRWSSIQSAVSSYDISGTVILSGNDRALVPNDMGHFCELFIGDEWNHHIFAAVLQHCTEVPCTYVEGPSLSAPPEPGKTVGLRHTAVGIYARLARRLVRRDDALLIKTYLPRLSELALQRRLGQVPQLWKSPSPVRVDIDWEQRQWTMRCSGQHGFEYLARQLIPQQLPSLYLEGYTQLVEQSRDLGWPESPKVIFTSNVLWHDTVSMAYTAEKVEAGAPLVYGQHGGIYGIAKQTWAEEHEVRISDRYLTWGWSDPARPTVVPVGMLKPSVSGRRRSNTRRRLLLVTLNQSRYTYRLSSESFASSERYFEDQLAFADALPISIRRELLVRLTPQEYGWHVASRWGDRHPSVALDPGSGKMSIQLEHARMVVHTYNSTGYLESIASNIPTVLFWDPHASPLRASAVPFLEELMRVGVFHESPRSAAEHVNNVWDDVDAWWNSAPVRQASAHFTDRFCRPLDDVVGRVHAELCDAMMHRTRRRDARGPDVAGVFGA